MSGWSDFFDATPAILAMSCGIKTKDKGIMKKRPARTASGIPPVRNAFHIHAETIKAAMMRSFVSHRSEAYFPSLST